MSATKALATSALVTLLVILVAGGYGFIGGHAVHIPYVLDVAGGSGSRPEVALDINALGAFAAFVVLASLFFLLGRLAGGRSGRESTV